MPDYFTDGFTVGTPSWHRKENLLLEVPDIKDGRRLAGQLWEPTKEVIYVAERDLEGTPTKMVPVESHRAVLRDDTKECIGVVGADFELVLNKTLWELAEAFLEAHSNARLDTAGVLKGGAQVWIAMYLDQPIEVKGDRSPSLPYCALLNGHDGSMALKSILTMVRIVCANTWHAADMDAARSGMNVSFRHTASIGDRVEQMKRLVLGMQSTREAFTEWMTELLGIPVEDKTIERFLVEFVPMPPDTMASDRVIGNVLKAREDIRDILNSPTCAGIENTAWGLVQAAGEFADHNRSWRSIDAYVSRTLLKPSKVKRNAVKLVRELVEAS